MKTEIIDDIKITYDDAISKDELLIYVDQEKDIYEKKGKILGGMEVMINGDEVEIKSNEKSPIQRVRRITGYLSNANNFNDAKRAELKARVAHVKI
jgi:Oxygen-sensitive ribonucleoside-triphosphate reductase